MTIEKYLTKVIILSIVFAYLISCSRIDPKVEKLLETSGSNKDEMQKVFLHFSQTSKDSLKLRAFLFLFENMFDRISYSGAQLNRFYLFIDSLSSENSTRVEFEAAVEQFYKNNKGLVGQLNLQKDINIITPQFLIKKYSNII